MLTMHFFLTSICLALSLFQNSFEEDNLSTKMKKEKGECPAVCQCSSFVTKEEDFFLFQLPKFMRTVNCSNKEIKTIPSQIPSNTQSLTMINNFIKDIYHTVPDLTELVYLDLSGNKIQNIGRGMIFKRLKKLKFLILSRNSFRILFAKVFSALGSLRQLKITHTKLQYIDEYAMEGLYQLTHLYLQANYLNSIFQEWFVDMHSLQVLDLSKNNVKFISADSLAPLNGLKFLDLNGNKIKGMSDGSLNGLLELQTLDLSNNHLPKVPRDALKRLVSLNTLDLSGNPIEKLQQYDVSNCSLSKLKLNEMPLLQLISSKAFSFLSNLSDLELNDNPKLAYIDEFALNSIDSSTIFIKIRSSGLKALPFNMISGKVSRINLDLSNNSLRCDCNIKWLIEETHSLNESLRIVNKTNLLCSDPDHFKEENITDLEPMNISDTCPAVTIRLGEPHIKAPARKRILLECRGMGIPTPSISWTLPTGRELNNSIVGERIFVTKDGSLQFNYTELSDNGEYMCSATNEFGQSNHTVYLNVSQIDLGIYANRISATFVSVVWNGTARNSYNVYKLLYRQSKNRSTVEEENGIFMVITVSPFDRFYTISELFPSNHYLICIAIEDGIPAEKLKDQIVSCVNVTTRGVGLILSQMSKGHSNVAVGITLGIIVLTVIVLCFVYLAAKRYRYGKYKDPEEETNKPTNTNQIPLETLYSPLISS